MNRNTESRFALNPSISIGRSTFKRPSTVKTSFNVGDLVPFYIDDVLPGDTFKIKTSKVVRMQPMVSAPMDNLYLDTYYFFVPLRLLWTHFREFMGENNESPWVPTTEYTIPQVTSPETTGWAIGTIADYFGVPTGITDLSINALPFRAYALIVDQWFKSTVVDDPVNVPVTDSTVAGSNGDNYITDLVKGGMPFKANKFFDYFTGALPSPQRGPDTLLPVAAGSSTVDSFPVYASGEFNDMANAPHDSNGNVYQLFFHDKDGKSFSPAGGWYCNGMKYVIDGTGRNVVNYGHYVSNGNDWTTPLTGVGPANLVADASALNFELSVGSINALRLAFQIQKYYEKLARGGDRYIEQILSMFGVKSPDARLQRTEYLGGNRCPINVTTVLQSSETGTTPQGNVVGNSLTVDVHSDFNHSFTEHGFVIGLMVARYDHTYQQGLEKLWSRKDKFDFYWPVFANIGEQPIKNKEIYAQGSSVLNPDTGKAYDEEVFAYQEAYADYRYKPSHVTSEMRSSYSASLDPWHFADDYAQMPTLSSDWLKEDKTNVDRVLAVKSTVSNQLFADIFVQNVTTRPMPMYSVPGLIDHN